MHEVNALLFDVFGTLVDWRSSIAREAREILSPRSITLDWDAILGAEFARDYKPSPGVYISAAAAGLRTAFIARPNERGPGKGESHAGSPVDISAASLTDLANRLGCD